MWALERQDLQGEDLKIWEQEENRIGRSRGNQGEPGDFGVQRAKMLSVRALREEGERPSCLALDRPSPQQATTGAKGAWPFPPSPNPKGTLLQPLNILLSPPLQSILTFPVCTLLPFLKIQLQ